VMWRFRKVLVEDSYPALVIIASASLIICFVDSLYLKAFLSPFLMGLGLFFQKWLRPTWFHRRVFCVIYAVGFLFIIWSFNYIVVNTKGNQTSIFIAFLTAFFAFLLTILDKYGQNKK